MQLTKYKRDARCARRVVKRMTIRVIAWTASQAGLPVQAFVKHVIQGRYLWMWVVGVKSVQQARNPMQIRVTVCSVLWAVGKLG